MNNSVPEEDKLPIQRISTCKCMYYSHYVRIGPLWTFPCEGALASYQNTIPLSARVCFLPYLISSFLSLSDDLSAAEFFTAAVVRFFFFFDRRDDDFRLDCSLRSSFPASSSSDVVENPSPSLFVVEGNILPLREDLRNGRDDDMVASFMWWKLWAKGDIRWSS